MSVKEHYTHRSGSGGERVSWQVIVNGHVRMIINPDGGVEFPPLDSGPGTPAAGGAVFFRVSGGKVQYCVQFPSGPPQILASEP